MSNIIFTPDDKKVISDFAAGLVRRQEFCRRCRWFVIAYIIFAFGLIEHVSRSDSNLYSILSLPAAGLKIPKNATPEEAAAVLERIVVHDDLEVAALRDEIYMMLNALILAATGVVLLLYVLSLWLNEKRDKALAKLLWSVASSGGDSGSTGANTAPSPTATVP